MTMTTRHACTVPASRVLEGYSTSPEGLVRGDLETVAYVCDEHAVAARKTWMPNLNVFDAIAESAVGHDCGEVHDVRRAGSR